VPQHIVTVSRHLELSCLGENSSRAVVAYQPKTPRNVLYRSLRQLDCASSFEKRDESREFSSLQKTDTGENRRSRRSGRNALSGHHLKTMASAREKDNCAAREDPSRRIEQL
jgi:hypothetical protein